jgi:KipI family sensor histidine kinase inhibitor
MGEFCLVIEFGDDASISHNFRVIALDDSLRSEPIPGVLETIPSTRSLAVFVDVDSGIRPQIEREVLARARAIDMPESIDSRIIEVPVCLDFDWEDVGSSGQEFAGDLAFVEAHNKLASGEFGDRLTQSEYWVSGLGFLPGNAFLYPLAAMGAPLTSPKLPTPRRWIPERALVIGGSNVAISPIETASGYRVVGRTPVDIYDPHRRNPVFADGPTLFRRADRVTWFVLGMADYRSRRAQVEAGTYEYVITSEPFDVRDYLGRLPSASGAAFAT